MRGWNVPYPQALPCPGDNIRVIRPTFENIFKDGTDYRSTVVILTKLSADRVEQPDLFEESVRIEKMRDLYGTIYEIAKKFGKHAVVLSPSLATFTKPQHGGGRGTKAEEGRPVIPGETKRKHPAIPFLGEAG
jgi:hypothetical protein